MLFSKLRGLGKCFSYLSIYSGKWLLLSVKTRVGTETSTVSEVSVSLSVLPGEAEPRKKILKIHRGRREEAPWGRGLRLASQSVTGEEANRTSYSWVLSEAEERKRKRAWGLGVHVEQNSLKVLGIVFSVFTCAFGEWLAPPRLPRTFLCLALKGPHPREFSIPEEPRCVFLLPALTLF